MEERVALMWQDRRTFICHFLKKGWEEIKEGIRTRNIAFSSSVQNTFSDTVHRTLQQGNDQEKEWNGDCVQWKSCPKPIWINFFLANAAWCLWAIRISLMIHCC